MNSSVLNLFPKIKLKVERLVLVAMFHFYNLKVNKSYSVINNC